MTSLPLIQLLEHELGDLARIAQYADGIGIAKLLATPEGVRAAHAVNLKVHVWTFRAENEFLPDDLKSAGDPGRARRSRGRNPPLSRPRHRRLFLRFSRRWECACATPAAYISGVQLLHQPLTETSLPGNSAQDGSCCRRFPAVAGNCRSSNRHVVRIFFHIHLGGILDVAQGNGRRILDIESRCFRATRRARTSAPPQPAATPRFLSKTRRETLMACYAEFFGIRRQHINCADSAALIFTLRCGPARERRTARPGIRPRISLRSMR